MEQNFIYLDNAGAARPTKLQLRKIFELFDRLPIGNPHSNNANSQFCYELIQQSRHRILRHFDVDRTQYDVIFTGNATHAMHILAQHFNFADGAPLEKHPIQKLNAVDEVIPSPCFAYVADNHSSCYGMRETITRLNPQIHLACLPSAIIDSMPPIHDDDYISSSQSIASAHSLLAFPGQSNHCGRKYPIKKLVNAARQGKIGGIAMSTCVDVASLVSTSYFSLKETSYPDFIPISFYKMFGFPTGLGALLVRKTEVAPGNTEALLKHPIYFGGGSVDMAIPGTNAREFRLELHEMFEAGTVDIYGIIALIQGFDTLLRLGGMRVIQSFTFNLAHYCYQLLLALKHANGSPLIQPYTVSAFDHPDKQGPIINFNVLGDRGECVSATTVEKMANLYTIQLRTGCFCNQGACQYYLHLTDDVMVDNYKIAGKKCGDEVALDDAGRPLASVRISFGHMNTVDDVHMLIAMLYDCFLTKSKNTTMNDLLDAIPRPMKFALSDNPDHITTRNNCIKNVDYATPIINGVESTTLYDIRTISEIFIYPVKSARSCKIKDVHPLCDTGLAYDRLWMICNENGACVTQKRCPLLTQLLPSITIADGHGRLGLSVLLNGKPHHTSLSLPDLNSTNHNEIIIDESSLCENTVCADQIATIDCGNAISDWLSDQLQLDKIRLRQQAINKKRMKDEQNVALANEAQILLLNRASIRALLPIIQSASHPDDQSQLTEDNLLYRFRANLIVDGCQPFEEDTWHRIKMLNGLELEVVKACHRCQMICIDQATGEKNPKILAALRDFRQGKMTFGVYVKIIAMPAEPTIRRGLTFTVIEK